MDRQEAASIIKETFNNPFDEDRFRYFTRNLFNEVDEKFTPPFAGAYIPDAYKEHIKQYKRIAKYSDPEGNVLDVLVVQLKRETALERARTMQRNFVSYYLKKRGEKDAAMVAFYTEGLEDWRFSYVRMDYKTIQTESGKVKVKEDLTPARRYSFLVGKNEPNHTAQQQLVPLLKDDRNNPLLTELEKAFNIESVTREFFSKYKDLFLKVQEELEGVVAGDKKIKSEFEVKRVDAVNFAKKLLGQIVFLYFIQKKGWLGVAKEHAWGTGPKNFMRRLFEKEIVTYDNFFNDILEPLFYEALAIDRGEVSLYSRFNCKIPFLNGGLFEPINGYNWEETDILLRNETFGEILDTFDLYNFTVREDEPLEREVAVDPEMLGKVFENLLEVKDRKSKGAYYTPREIVHYMCQESLINYLDTAINTHEDNVSKSAETLPLSVIPACRESFLKKDAGQVGMTDVTKEVGGEADKLIPREDIEAFIRRGDFAINNDLAKEQGTTSYSYKMPESIRSNARLFDNKLSAIKICDPAIGSGAFPVGMMHEIVRARETLTTYLPTLKKDHLVSPTLAKGGEGGFSNKRTAYNFKRHAIQESIYGIDIDAGAVDIAKLRLWLSLVVDEEDFKTIKPLPNLDYKIVCGNSLSSVNSLFHHTQLKEMEGLKGKYFEETNPRKKIEFKEKIDTLIREITNNDEHFDFKVYFSEVFDPPQSPLAKGGSKGGGFDITIANPPYVRHEAIKEQKPQLKKEFGSFYCGTADLYTYFYKKGIELLKPGGHLCFIAPNKFMRAGYGKNTRLLLAREVTPKVVIDFCDLPIFDATTYPSIVLVERKGGSRTAPTTDKFLAATFSNSAQLDRLEETLSDIGFSMPVSALREEGWNLEQPEILALMEKLRSVGKSLGEYVQGRFYRGVLTGLNEAFVIDGATRNKLISDDPKSEKIIKPWLRGRDIKKWKAEWADLYLIGIPSSSNHHWPWSDEKSESKAKIIFRETFPAIHDHLIQWKDKLQKRDDQGKFWWELRACAYYQEFEQPKIVYPNITKTNIFSFDTTGILTNQKCFIIPTDDLCLLAILNSSLGMLWFVSTLPLLRGSFFEPSAIFMQYFPIASASDKQKAPIIERVQKILANPDSPDVPRFEAEINKLVYALYDLKPEEIAIVEGNK